MAPLCGKNTLPVGRKLVVCGDGACGKTSLLNRFTRDYFPQVYEPTVFENYVQDIEVDGQEVELSLWDTAGQEELDRLRSLSYANTHVVMLCFSIDSRDSLDNIQNRWIEEISEHCPMAKIVLVALKCDLRDSDELTQRGRTPVMYEEGLAMARSINALRYLECSAKHNRGVQKCFEEAAKVALKVQLQQEKSNTKSCIIS